MTEKLKVGREATNRLAELGLPDANVFVVAIERGIQAYAECTLNDVGPLPGYLRWAKTTRGLRDALAGKGWRRANHYGLEVVERDDETVAIAVSMGNEATGTDVAPKTKYRKGPATVSVVNRNNSQLELFPDMLLPAHAAGAVAEEGVETKTLTYFLLMRVSLDAKEVISELSLPQSLGSDSRVQGWRDRISLPVVNVDAKVDLSKLKNESADFEFDVPVARKPDTE